MGCKKKKGKDTRMQRYLLQRVGVFASQAPKGDNSTPVHLITAQGVEIKWGEGGGTE